MSKGFKKSLFGFNCDEVVAYIEKAHKTFKEKELLLNEKIDSLSSELKESSEKNLALTEENANKIRESFEGKIRISSFRQERFLS